MVASPKKGGPLLNQPTAHLGRRGLSLILFGILWTLVGVGILGGPSDRFSRPGPGGTLEFMDSANWAWMWIGFGALSVISGFLRRRVRLLDEWGFNSLLIPAWVWTLTYGWSAVTYIVTMGEYGQGRAWVGCVVYGVISLAILVIAGWPDPSDERAIHQEA